MAWGDVPFRRMFSQLEKKGDAPLASIPPPAKNDSCACESVYYLGGGRECGSVTIGDVSVTNRVTTI